MEASELMLMRKKLLAEAKLAEQNGNYTQMAIDMMGIVLAASPEVVLTPKERSLLGVAFKNHISRVRKAQCTLEFSIPSSGGNVDAGIEAFLFKLNTEIAELCSGFTLFIDRFLLPFAISRDSKVFYLTLKAEFSWYSAKARGDEQGRGDALVAKEAYAEAREIAKGLELLDPCRLALKLSLAEYFIEYLHKPIIAGMVTDEALGDVLSGSDSGSVVSIMSCEGALGLSGKLSRWMEKLNDQLQSNAAEDGNARPVTPHVVHDAPAPSLQPSSGRSSPDSSMLHLLRDAMDSFSITKLGVAQAAKAEAAASHPTKVEGLEASALSAIATDTVVSEEAPDANPLESGPEVSLRTFVGGLLQLDNVASTSISDNNVTPAANSEAVIIDCPTMLTNAASAMTEAVILHQTSLEAPSPYAMATDTIMVSVASPVVRDSRISQSGSAVSTRSFKIGLLPVHISSSSITGANVNPTAMAEAGVAQLAIANTVATANSTPALKATDSSVAPIVSTADPSDLGSKVSTISFGGGPLMEGIAASSNTSANVTPAKTEAVISHPIMVTNSAATADSPSISAIETNTVAVSLEVPVASIADLSESGQAVSNLGFERGIQLVAKLTSFRLLPVTNTNVEPSTKGKAGAAHPITAAHLAAASTVNSPSTTDTTEGIASYSEAESTVSSTISSKLGAALSLRFEGSFQLVAKLTSLK